MIKLYLFAAVFLFWVALTTSLLQVQLAASPMHRMRVPTYRSVPMRAISVAQVAAAPSANSYN